MSKPGKDRDTITDRTKAEEALKKSEEKFSKAFRASPEAVSIVLMENGKHIEVNDAFLSATGFQRDEVIGRTSTELGLWVEAGERLDFVDALSKKGFLRNFETRFRMPSGDVKVFLLSSEIVEINGSSCSLNFIIDITGRKRSEEALRDSENRLRTIIEMAPIAMAIISLDGKVEFINRKATAVFGYTLQDVPTLDKWWSQAYPNVPSHEELAADWANRVRQALAEGREIEGGEYPVTCKDGTVKAVITSGVPVSGKIFVIFDDITELRRAEADRLKLEQQAQQYQKLESLGVLAGGIAHDFNNLMGGVFGYIDLSIAASTDKKVSTLLSKAVNAIGRARGLTAQLLTFAKGGAPVQEITTVAPLLREAVQFALSGSSISCRFSIAANLRLCNIDKNQIAQVIDNIVINAHQAMPNGGTVSVTAENISFTEKEHAVLPAGDYVRISIKDSGIGIPREILPRIFDPFYTTKSEGRGLGLATSYSIIKRHAGAIDVESEPGKGSTFYVCLPAAPKGSVLLSKEESAQIQKGSGRILLMDDEELIRESTEEMLAEIGYSVVCKENGKDAIQFFVSETNAKRNFAAMIFDLTVPGGMGGKDAVREIRKINPTIPVFVSSGYADDPVMKNPERYGFTASICKPFTLSDLGKMLARHLNQKRSG
jgi:two-component system, cell cycle sensor histidine kinase and response regulator CckA